MEYLAVVILAAVTFGICYLFDKGFVSLFRNKVQHRSGLAVRVHKRYAAFGLILFALGVAAFFTGLSEGMVLLVGGIVVAVTGVCMIVYYMTFGIFYDEDTFLLTTFGKKSTVYRYADIKAQQLYNASGNIVIELHLADGRTVNLQARMEGVYPFLDKAFAPWCAQTGTDAQDCSFHDPDNSCWFPGVEEA